MPKYILRWGLVALGLAALSLVVLTVTTYAATGLGPATVREFDIKASQFAYEPATIVVNKGDTVRIRLEATDVTHGLYVDTYGVSVAASPGQPGVLEFVADRAGKFRFRCAETCGPLHPFMIGQLEVRPNGPLSGSLVLTFGVGAVTLAYVWRKKEADNGDHA